MRNPENNEIDLLLRHLARRATARSGGAGTEGKDGPGEHLDADELSSFAEGVLPDTTRSLYAAHLADCSHCRRIVAQLVVSSGAAVRQLAVEPSKSTWWSFIASFFAPGVMRYAVPALSLVILAAIAFVSLRQTRQGDRVAQVEQVDSEPAAPGQYGATQDAPSEVQTSQDSAPRSGALKTATTNAQETSKDAKRSEAKNETVATDSMEREQKRSEPTTNVRDAAQPSPSRVPDANTAFSPQPHKEVVNESKREQLARARQAPAEPAAVAQSEDDRRNRQDKDDAVAKQKAGAKTGFETGAVAGRRSMTTGNTESRTVAGRHFRRINNAWVDTAYDPGAQTITLARGSEQYRALTGDEPGLRTIAEELKGEVIVVWKGRAYRIR
jgi:hypothetical protein